MLFFKNLKWEQTKKELEKNNYTYIGHFWNDVFFLRKIFEKILPFKKKKPISFEKKPMSM